MSAGEKNPAPVPIWIIRRQKYSLSTNLILSNRQKNIVKAINTEFTPKKLEFPAIEEKSFKRTEDAAEYLKTLKEQGYTFVSVGELIYRENYRMAVDGSQIKNS